MVQVASLFNQLLQHFPRTEFAALVKKHGGEHAAKGFTCWTQFVSMLFCQLGRTDSLREICNGLSCCLGRLVHVGISKAPCRSTLSYANQHRPAALFEELFWTASARFREQQALGGRKHKFRFKNKLLSLDSTTISLCLTLFPWAKFRRAKGGVKAHVLLDHDDYLPAYVLLTEARRSDVKLADSFALNPGSIVAMDRGYTDYALFGRWTTAGVFFVTRLKDNAAFAVEAEFQTPANRNIRADQIIRLTGGRAQTDCPGSLRRLVVWDADNQREIVLLTNLFDFGATTIAAIYKERWQIELFFESSTWCTPLDVMEFRGSTALSRPLVGSLGGSVLPCIARRPRCGVSRVHPRAPTQGCVAGNCFNPINRKTVVGVTPRAAATSLTDISPRACRSPSW
jgi:hypothetical protein